MAREPFDRTWAETPEQFEEPSESTWTLGWEGGADKDPPEAKWQNWWQQRADIALRQIEREGAMEWLSAVPYETWALAKADNGDVYIAVQPNQGADPALDDGSNWLTLSGFIKASFNATGSAPLFGVRAWANFNGANFDIAGNVDIRASGNISSIVRTGEGIYVVSFSSPMEDASYSVGIGVCEQVDGNVVRSDQGNPTFYEPGSFEIHANVDTSANISGDLEIVNFIVVR